MLLPCRLSFDILNCSRFSAIYKIPYVYYRLIRRRSVSYSYFAHEFAGLKFAKCHQAIRATTCYTLTARLPYGGRGYHILNEIWPLTSYRTKRARNIRTSTHKKNRNVSTMILRIGLISGPVGSRLCYTRAPPEDVSQSVK